MATVSSVNYIYCVGGATAAGVNTNAVYYATLTAGTVGAWSSGTNYPTNIEAESCVTNLGFITCVAGLTAPGFISTITSATYYAPISGSGVGAWTETTDYGCVSSCHSDGSTGLTDNLNACSVWAGYIFCMGGEYDMALGFLTGDVFSNTISSGAVGATWTATTTYPVGVAQGAGSCAMYSAYWYCIAGNGATGESVRYASVTSGTLGAWTSGPDYGVYALTVQVVSFPGYLYGVGGQTNAAYYSQIGGGLTATTTVVSCLPASFGIGSGSTCTATVTGSAPTGTVTFTQAGAGTVTFSSGGMCTLSAGSCFVTATGATAGAVTVTGTYGGDGSNSGSFGTDPVTVNPSLPPPPPPPPTPVCPSTIGGVFMPVGATFMDTHGNTWVAPGGSLGGGTVQSYFFVGPMSSFPPPMMGGWGGVYGTYGGQMGWIVTFFCA